MSVKESTARILRAIGLILIGQTIGSTLTYLAWQQSDEVFLTAVQEQVDELCTGFSGRGSSPKGHIRMGSERDDHWF